MSKFLDSNQSHTVGDGYGDEAVYDITSNIFLLSIPLATSVRLLFLLTT
jgi:hypothetical protein